MITLTRNEFNLVTNILNYSKNNRYNNDQILSFYEQKKYPFLNPSHSIELLLKNYKVFIGYWEEVHPYEIIIKRLNIGYDKNRMEYTEEHLTNDVLNLFEFSRHLNDYVMGAEKPQSANDFEYSTTSIQYPFVYIPIKSGKFGRRMNFHEIIFPLEIKDNTVYDVFGKWRDDVMREILKYSKMKCPKYMPEHNFIAMRFGLEKLAMELHNAIEIYDAKK